MNCPKCFKNTIKFGFIKAKQKSKIQRYSCKNCGLKFTKGLTERNSKVDDRNVIMVDIFKNKLERLQNFYLRLIDDNIRGKDFTELRKEITKVLVVNNVPTFIIYELYNRKISIRTIQRIKKEIITPVHIDKLDPNGIKHKYETIDNKMISIKREFITKYLRVKSYQKVLEKLKNPQEIEEWEKSKDYDKHSLTRNNIQKLFKDNASDSKNLFTELKEMYMYIEVGNKRSKKIK